MPLVFKQYFQMKKEIECQSEQAHQKQWESPSPNLKDQHEQNYQKQICRPYPNEIQKATVNLISTVYCLHLIPIIASYILLSNNNDQTTAWLEDTFRKAQIHEIPIIGCILILKLIVIIAISLDYKFCHGEQIHNLLIRLVEYLRGHLRILVQIDLLSSAFFLTLKSPISLINFLLSAAIIVFSWVYLENYSDKKDRLYIGSIIFHVIMRTKVIISLFIGFFCLCFSKSSISLNMFLITHAILAIITIFAYLSEGFIIYRNATSRRAIFISVSAHQSLAATMIIGVVSHLDFSTFVVYSLLATLAVSFCLSCYMQMRKQQVTNKSSSLELQAFNILQILEQSIQDQQKQLFLIGLLDMHSLQSCKNPQCYANKGNFQDGMPRGYYSFSDLHKGNASLVNFYLKCKFESFLLTNSINFNAMLSYAEFLFHQLNNVALALFYLKKIQLNKIKLTWNNKLKLDSLTRGISSANKLFCQQVYGSKMEIEELIKAEDTNRDISSMTLQLLQERIQIWTMLKSGQINVSQVMHKTENTMKKLEGIQSKWMALSSYVQRSNKWKYEYICFALLLKNERLKAKTLEEFNNAMQGLMAKNISADASIKSIASGLFDSDSCCIHAYLEEDNLFVKKSSKNLANVTGYTNDELENANLNILMPNNVAEGHAAVLTKMSQQGSFSIESNYMIKEVYLINKKGFIVPVAKLYKEYVTQKGELEYVCFFKKIREQQHLLLCKQNFDILGITQGCSEVISQQSNNAEYIKTLNLISLIPGLAKFTKYKDYVFEKEALYPIASNKHQLSYNHNSGSVLTNPAEQLNLVYPLQSLQRYSQYYKALISNIVALSLQDMYSCILRVTEDILSQPNQLFQCSVAFKYINNKYGMEYFEVKFSKIRANQPKNQALVRQNVASELISQKQIVKSQFLIQETPKELNILNISAKANIYIKQQTNVAPRTNIYLKYMNYIWIVLFVQLAALAIINKPLFAEQFNKMAVSINNIYQSGQVSITSSRLINLYIANILNITTISSIQQTTQIFENLINDPLMHQAFFDKAINPPSIYYASSDFTKNYTGYNEVDFLYFAESVYQTLAQPQQMTISSSVYKLIMDYQYPPLNQYFNRTNINLSIEFNQIESKLIKESAIILVFQLVLIIASAVLVIALSFKFYGSMLEMVKIHCHFARSDIQKNITHIKRLINIFKDLQSLDTEKEIFSVPSKTSRNQRDTFIDNKIFQNNNLNKKSKKIIAGKILNRKKISNYIKVTACLTVLICLSVLRNIYCTELKNNAKNQEIIGQNFFNFVPTHYLTAQIMASAYSADAVPAYFPEQYLPLLSNLFIQMSMPYISTPQSDAFSQLNKQFSFGDACAISVQSLDFNNISLKECYSTANHSLSGGLQQYSRYQYDMMRKFFNRTNSLSFQQLTQYFRSIDIYHTINNFMAQAWADNYASLTADILAKIDQVTFLSLCVILLMIALYKIFLFDYLKNEYKIYYFFYANMMPEEVVSGEKRIRSKLSEIHFL